MNDPTKADEVTEPGAPPRAVAVSGLIFSACYITSMVMIRLAAPAHPSEPGSWLTEPDTRGWVLFAINLIPFTGIAFLWFMAVLRNRIGKFEDRLFATVFLGSGLLFVAMLFVAAALCHGLLSAFDVEGRVPAQSETYAVARSMTYALMNTFAVKMAAVFIIVVSTISRRTAIYPRWMAFLGYGLALVMLLTVNAFAWITLLFPAWVTILSVHLLATTTRQ